MTGKICWLVLLFTVGRSCHGYTPRNKKQPQEQRQPQHTQHRVNTAQHTTTTTTSAITTTTKTTSRTNRNNRAWRNNKAYSLHIKNNNHCLHGTGTAAWRDHWRTRTRGQSFQHLAWCQVLRGFAWSALSNPKKNMGHLPSMAKNIKWRILMVIGTMEGPQKLQNVRPWHVWSPPMLVFSSFIKQPIWWGTLSKNMPTKDQRILRDAHGLQWLKHKSTHLTWRQWWPKQHIHWFYHRLYRSPSSWPEKNHWRIKANCIPWESQESVAWRSHPFFPSKDTPPRVKSP